MIVEEIKVEQRSEEWLALRKQNIGASDIPILLGISQGNKNIHDLWMEKTGRKLPDPPNEAMLRGVRLEPDAKAVYIAETGVTLETAVLKAKDKPYMASLDGWNKEKKRVVELKCPEKVISLIKAEESSARLDHYAQNQWQLMLAAELLGIEGLMGQLTYYHPEYKTIIKEVFPDLEFQENARKVADAFWDLVINDVEPEDVRTTHIKLDSGIALAKAEEIRHLELEIEELKEKQKLAKKVLIEESDGGNFEVNGVKYTQHNGRITVRYKEVCQAFNITPAQLKPFTTKGEPGGRWDISLDK